MSRLFTYLPLLLLLTSQVTGCSLLAVTGPPAGHEELERFDCTTENYAPAFDVALSAGHVGGVIAGIAVLSDSVEANDVQGGILLAGAGALVAIHAVSAKYGYEATAECRQARIEGWKRMRAAERGLDKRMLKRLKKLRVKKKKRKKKRKKKHKKKRDLEQTPVTNGEAGQGEAPSIPAEGGDGAAPTEGEVPGTPAAADNADSAAP